MAQTERAPPKNLQRERIESNAQSEEPQWTCASAQNRHAFFAPKMYFQTDNRTCQTKQPKHE
jgi:hypothetical protein